MQGKGKALFHVCFYFLHFSATAIFSFNLIYETSEGFVMIIAIGQNCFNFTIVPPTHPKANRNGRSRNNKI